MGNCPRPPGRRAIRQFPEDIECGLAGAVDPFSFRHLPGSLPGIELQVIFRVHDPDLGRLHQAAPIHPAEPLHHSVQGRQVHDQMVRVDVDPHLSRRCRNQEAGWGRSITAPIRKESPPQRS